MWKWFILFVLQTNIISQAVTVNENVREPRQSNGDCCPCPDAGRSGIDDQDALGTQIVSQDDCPCRASDSESAPSIFRPVFRDAETYTRPPATKGDPKPLLKPEVGLASAVLETLREVTDEEYRDAVFRDMARNAIKSADPDSSQKESLSNVPRKIVNIIVQPKADNTDDVIPQASNIQTVKYVYPHISETNSFDDKRGHSLKLFRDPFTLPKLTKNGILQKNLFDMDNSASNIQEHLFRPLKSNFLEDFKLKSDFLKYKLFPMTRNSLHEAQPTYTIGNSGSDCEHVHQTSNYRMPSIGNQIIQSKESNSLGTLQPITNTEIQKNSKILSSPTKAAEYYDFNLNDAKLRSRKLDTLSADTITSTMRTEFVSNTNSRNLKSNTFDDTSKSIRNDDCNGRSDEGSSENTDQVNKDDTHMYDGFSSPSEIHETKQSESVKNSDLKQESGSREDKTLDTSKFDSGSQQKIIETPPSSDINEFSGEDNVDADETNIEYIDDHFISKENKKDLCSVNDSEIGASSNNMQSAVLYENLNDEPKTKNRNIGSDEESSAFDYMISTTTEKFTAEKTQKFDLKNNILKKIQSLKKTTEKIPDKFKSNAQDTLHLFKEKTQAKDKDNMAHLSRTVHVNENEVPQHNSNAMNKEIESSAILNSKEMNINEDNKCDEIDLHNKEDTSNANNILLPTSTKDDYAEDLPSNNDSGISTKSLEDSCDDISPSSFANVVNDSDSRNTEMESQASSPVINSIPGNNNADCVEAKIKSNVRGFFENFKSSLPNIGANKDSSTLMEMSSRENNDRIIGRSYTRNQLSKSRKSNPNLESYKAKVPVPEVLNMNPEVSTLQQSYDASSIFNTVQSPQNKPNPFKLNEMVRNANIRQRAESTVRNEDKFNKVQKISPSHNYRNIQARTDDTIRNIQQTLDNTLRQPLLQNQNGIFSDINSKNIFGNILKTNEELSEKLRAFHSDVNNKISSFSQKLSDVSGTSLQAQNKYSPIKQIQTLKSSSQSKPQYKILTQPKNKNYETRPLSIFETRSSLLKGNRLNNGLGLNGRENIYKPRQTQSKLSMKQSPSEPAKLLTSARPTKLSKESIRSQLRKDLKLKPFKDSKISIRFSSTQRPELIKAVPSTIKSKSLLRTPLQKRPELKPKPKSVDSNTLASERISSSIPSPPKSSNKSYKISSNLELSDDSTNLKSDNILKIGSTGKIKNSMLSKLRETVDARTKANKMNGDNISNSNALSDVTQSASSNNALSIQARQMKENVSYKCKMVCIEDKSD